MASQKKKLTRKVTTIEEDALPIVREEVETTDENKQEGNLFKKILIWSGVAIVIGVLLGISWKLTYERGIVVGQQQMQEKQEKEALSKQKEITPTPTAEEIAKNKYPIEVLNGSGIAGEAARVKALLEKEGFAISAVGNADESDIAETTIQAKSSVIKGWIDILKTTLSESLIVSEPTSLDDEESTDVIVTVGSKKAE